MQLEIRTAGTGVAPGFAVCHDSATLVHCRRGKELRLGLLSALCHAELFVEFANIRTQLADYGAQPLVSLNFIRSSVAHSCFTVARTLLSVLLLPPDEVITESHDIHITMYVLRLADSVGQL